MMEAEFQPAQAGFAPFVAAVSTARFGGLEQVTASRRTLSPTLDSCHCEDLRSLQVRSNLLHASRRLLRKGRSQRHDWDSFLSKMRLTKKFLLTTLQWRQQ